MRVVRYQTIGPRDGTGTPPEPEERCGPSGKRIYPTEDAALCQAIVFATNNHYDVGSKDAYLCEHAPHWHLTGRSKRRKR